MAAGIDDIDDYPSYYFGLRAYAAQRIDNYVAGE